MPARLRENRRSSRCSKPLLKVFALAVFALMVITGCGAGAAGRDRTLSRATDPNGPVIVATFPVTAALVAQLVGDTATVRVLMPNGVDPHDYRPSARDMEVLDRADLVVMNGFGLEESLTAALERVESRGTPMFRFSDHVRRRQVGANAIDDHAIDDHAAADHAVTEHDDGDGEEDGDDHGHGGLDPHFWVDPVAMAEAIVPLAKVIEDDLGIHMVDRLAAVESELTRLDQQVTSILSVVAPGHRHLVTGHESLGFFADRYGFEVVGTVVSSLSSQASPSAADIALLKRQIESFGVTTIFNEVGTPKALSKVIAEETGVTVVELNTHKLPDDHAYSTFMIELANGIATGLEAAPELDR